jgi:hypothetical protein
MAGAFATFFAMRISVRASVTSINGLTKAGQSGFVNGADQCTGDTIPAVAVPKNPGFTAVGRNQNDKNKVLETLIGKPKIDSSLGPTSDSAATGIPFDWRDIVYGGAIQATYTVPNGGNAANYFPARGDTAAWNAFPTIIVRNGPTGGSAFELDTQDSGKGLLIVFGDLVTKGAFAWEGVIIVGSQLTMRGTEDVTGAVSTGLNAKLRLPVGESDLGIDDLRGNTKLRYNSCAVRSAMTSLGALRAYQNTWANNFPAY